MRERKREREREREKEEREKERGTGKSYRLQMKETKCERGKTTEIQKHQQRTVI